MEDESLTKLPIDEFLKRLASDAPTPGGGSVAALTGALAAALGQMVSALTVGRPRFAAVESQVRAVADRLSRARDMLCKLVDEDAAAYGVLRAAFKLDKHDPQRAEQVQRAAGLAGSVPLETVAVSATVFSDLKHLRKLGNPLLRPDVEAGIHHAQAAMHAAAANVRANLPLMSTREADHIDKQLEALLTDFTN